MRDLLNILDSVLNEVTISKAKYGPGTQFSLSGSVAGQKMLALMQQQEFDPTPPLTMQDVNSMSNEEILGFPTVTVGTGPDGYVFSNNAGQMLLVTGSASAIGPMFNAYSGAGAQDGTGDAEGKIANRGETSEGILGAAMFAKFTKREPNEEIGTVTPQDINTVLDNLKQTGEDQYEVEVQDFDNKHADSVAFVLKLKSGSYADLMDPNKRGLLANEFSSAAGYVNSADAERYSRYFYINGKADQIVIMADGVTGEKTQKTDVWVYVTDENGQPRKLRLNTSLKVGGIGQFGQVGGDSEETQQTLWNYFGIDVDPALKNFGTKVKKDPRQAFKNVYQYAAKQIDDQLQGADADQEAAVINNIAQGITHFATLGDPRVELVDFNKGGFKILRFNNLVQKLQTVNLAASYVDDKKWPEVSIHERGNPKNKLLTVRMKIENKPTKKNPDALYIRNYIEKESLLEKLTEYRRASWDEAGGVSTADLDQQLKKPRLTGPGARGPRSQAEPDYSPDVLGRKKRS
jgi:hypothetical protein